MITRVDPADPAGASTVQVDSDAESNIAAIREIEAWAANNGFVRTSEYALRQTRIDGRRYFRGVCFRMDEDERRAREAAHDDFVRRGDSLRTAFGAEGHA